MSRGFKICLIVMAVSLLVCVLFAFNSSPSMPMGLYLRIPAFDIKEGDIVAFENPMSSSMWGVNNSGSVIKTVYKVNDKTVVLKGESTSPYDSRYFGELGRSYIRFKVIPVFTFTEAPYFIQKIFSRSSKV